MSFRTRLTLFFVIIALLPMVAVAVLVTRFATESRTGKADARLAEGTSTALVLYRRNAAQARADARRAAREGAFMAALRSHDPRAIAPSALQVERDLHLAGLTVRDPHGRELASPGTDNPIAGSRLEIRGPNGTIATLNASEESAGAFVADVHALTGRDAAVFEGDRPVASTTNLGNADVPADSGDVALPSGDVRVASTSLAGAGGDRLALFTPLAEGGTTIKPLVAAALVAFFAIAVLFVVLLLRTLQGQVKEMLEAARRIGSGDFSRPVPVEGSDELAGLATEFNKMSDRLSAQMDELRRQRRELEQSVRRIGDAFAAGLDREALLEIVAQTALAACEADSCRIDFSGSDRDAVKVGDEPSRAISDAMREATATALRDSEVAEARRDGGYALGQPLIGTQNGGRAVAAMAIARSRAPFDAGEREMLRYLAGQASVSVENVNLHEVVSAQAVTDELTGLSNQRRFNEWIGNEAERASRFGHDLSLLVLDIDDFKRVNDTHGHLQGDEVLRTIGRVLRDVSRGVDEPSRYGGEEFTVALPETGLDEAVKVAERIRERIAQARVPLVEDSGMIQITASLGVASLRETGPGVQALFGAADEALYRAKAGGKNRTERASGRASGEPVAQTAQGPPQRRRS